MDQIIGTCQNCGHKNSSITEWHQMVDTFFHKGISHHKPTGIWHSGNFLCTECSTGKYVYTSQTKTAS